MVLGASSPPGTLKAPSSPWLASRDGSGCHQHLQPGRGLGRSPVTVEGGRAGGVGLCDAPPRTRRRGWQYRGLHASSSTDSSKRQAGPCGRACADSPAETGARPHVARRCPGRGARPPQARGEGTARHGLRHRWLFLAELADPPNAACPRAQSLPDPSFVKPEPCAAFGGR